MEICPAKWNSLLYGLTFEDQVSGRQQAVWCQAQGYCTGLLLESPLGFGSVGLKMGIILCRYQQS